MPAYFRFHVRLLGVETRLWRRFLLREDAVFADLHAAIQDACGWEGRHLFEFRSAGGRRVLAGMPGGDGARLAPDARLVRITSALGDGHAAQCLYVYDFGDDWRHEVTIEAIEHLDDRFERRLVDGEGAFPPEDCGSIPGYERAVAAVTGEGWTEEFGEPSERRELLQWLEGWKPDRFDLALARRSFDA